MRTFFTFSILILIAFSCGDSENNEVKPQTKNITESVYASVSVRPQLSYFPQPMRSGIVKEIYGQEGDLVKKGQILLEITPTETVKGQLVNAQINLQEAKSNYLGSNNLLKNISLEISITKEQLSLDSTNYERQKELKKKNVGRTLDLDQAKAKYFSTQQQLGVLEKKYSQTKTNLQSNYKKALSQTKTEKSQLNDFTIRSEMDGKIYTINKEIGDYISSQEKFAEIGSSNDFKLQMDIDEVDITKIELGDSVIIKLDAYENELFIAIVDKIFPKKDDITQTFRVEGRFTEKPPKLFNGLSGEANIIVSERKNALVIPSEYLLPNNKVLTEDGEKSIKTGLKNLKFTEVIAGIDSTTTLLKPTE